MNPLLHDPDLEIAYLGPEGSFAHWVAQQRYGSSVPKRPFSSVPEVFAYVLDHQNAKGVVPIENSSGGMILSTVDGLIEHACELFIEEDLSIDVKLALLARKGSRIHTVYSHFAPLQHCEPYLRARYPHARAVACSSTSASAEMALNDPDGAAIGNLAAAEIYGLEVLDYPVRQDVPNVTQFFVLGHKPHPSVTGGKTSLVVALANQPGSLCDFLQPLKNGGVNLTRIQSRPIVGVPNTYRFLIEINGTEADANVREALQAASKVATIHNVGSYPVLPRYQSV